MQVVTTQPGSVHVYRDNSQVNSTAALIFSIIVAVCCGICVPLTLVWSIPAIIFAALASHNKYMSYLSQSLGMYSYLAELKEVPQILL